METGFIYTYCPHCGIKNRVKVIFPAWNQGFRDTLYECIACHELAKVIDPHKYGITGNLIY